MDERIPFLPRLLHALANFKNRIGAICGALVWPLERAFMAVLGSVFAFLDWFESIDSIAHRTLQMAVAPFRYFWQISISVARLLVPSSFRNIVAAPVYGATWLIGFVIANLVKLAERLSIDDALLYVAQLSRPIWYPIGAVGMFCVLWFATRPYKRLLWCIPAMLLAVPILLATIWGAFLGKNTIAAQYQAALSRSLESKDYSQAQLFERKLASMGVEMPLAVFNNARALEKDGKISESYGRMQKLASPDAPGYPPAHLWIAQHLLLGQLDVPAAEAHRLADLHLKQLAILSVKGPVLDMMRASWLIDENKLEEAAALLKPLARNDSSAATERFRINLQLKHTEQARSDAQEVCQHMRRLSGARTELSSRDFETWAAAEELLQNYAELRDVANKWLSRYPDSTRARKSVAAICGQELNEMLRSSSPDPKQLAERLFKLFEVADESENMRGRLAVLYQQRTSRPELRSVFEILAEKQDKSSALAEALGTAASVRGEWDQAQVYLQQAVQKDPNNAVAWNNLACVLLEKEHASIDNALVAANKATELKPNDYKFRETRGEVLLRLGHWEQAAEDLEYAINGMPESQLVHRLLYQAYMGLGKKDLAAAHAQTGK